MKSVVPAIIFLFFATTVNAGFTGAIIAYGSGGVPVNTSIDMNTDYVAIPVYLSSDAKYPSQLAKQIAQLEASINKLASFEKGIDFQQGLISLSPRQKSSFSISKSYGRHSGSNFYIFSKLDETRDVYAATQAVYSFISKIQVPDDAEYSLGNTSLAISNPSQYREKLLAGINAEIESTRKIFGSNYEVSISGLENPVIVRQKNDRQVTVYIDYRLEFTE
ncbi:hypothetical protein [Agaribacterium sp. ZY112]|uniref:hypothetical protein n=1 Tax=Agaribacterium sp. ZY112 TaxID=3233574 RepID=UPI003525774C